MYFIEWLEIISKETKTLLAEFYLTWVLSVASIIIVVNSLQVICRFNYIPISVSSESRWTLEVFIGGIQGAIIVISEIICISNTPAKECAKVLADWLLSYISFSTPCRVIINRFSIDVSTESVASNYRIVWKINIQNL